MSMSAPHRTDTTDAGRAEPRQTANRTVIPTDRARQGVTGQKVRWVLGVGLAAIIIAFAAIYVFYFGA